jgi:hypothetical protein
MTKMVIKMKTTMISESYVLKNISVESLQRENME